MESHRSSAGMGGFWKVDVSLVAAGNAPLPASVGSRAYPGAATWTTLQSEGAWKKLERTTVSSAGGKLVFSASRFDQDEDEGKVVVAGFKWKQPIDSRWSSSPLAVLVNLLDAPRLIHTVPPLMLVDGPPSSAGPGGGATKQLDVVGEAYVPPRSSQKPELRLTFYAQPETLLDAPLPVRFGIIEQQSLLSSERYVKIIDWK